ncbi:MAG: hypothetical protein H6822_26225 [Planctomycetaceae bacterium]|nr:hypothetical protein [Planctomycetales bacterium]MCB9925675.1 hypothetical protein [Planctomycetaceae bacterium]
MYVPDRSLARQMVEFDEVGTLLLFEVHDYIKFPREPAHNEMSRLLSLDGAAHRNVFLVAQDGSPLWRAGDYEQHDEFPDQFVEIWKEDSTECAYGWTFCGYKIKIQLADGTVTILEWTK